MRMTQGTGPYFVFSYLKEINNKNTWNQFQFRWSKNGVIEIWKAAKIPLTLQPSKLKTLFRKLKFYNFYLKGFQLR